MKSSQINFYIHPEELQEFESYLDENNWLIFDKYSTDEKPAHLKSIKNDSKLGLNVYYLAQKQETDYIKLSSIEPSKYMIDVLNSQTIEFLLPNHDSEKNTLTRGRLYYIKERETGNTIISKEESFLKSANELFKWFKKNFKDAKLPNYKGILTSESVAEKLNHNEIKLIEF